jgi:hypothetical protein
LQILDPVLSDPRIRDVEKIQIREKHSRSYLRKLSKIFWAKIIDFFDADADPGSSANLTPDPVIGMEKFGSRINIPDPQHCLLL